MGRSWFVQFIVSLFLLGAGSSTLAQERSFSEQIEFDAAGFRSKVDALFESDSFESTAPEHLSVSLPIGNGVFQAFALTKSPAPLVSETFQGAETRWRTVDLTGESFLGTALVTEYQILISLLGKGGGDFIHIVPAPTGEGYMFTREPFSPSDSSCGFSGDNFIQNLTLPDLKNPRLQSKPLTQPRLRSFRLAINADKTFIEKFGTGSDLRRKILELVNDTNSFFIRKRLNISLVVTSIREFPNQDLTLEESADYFVRDPGIDYFDLGHLLTSRLPDPMASGRAAMSGACGVSGDKEKGRGVSLIDVFGGVGLRTFAHEVGHQFGMNHTWADCSSAAYARNDNTAFEATDGATVMSYNRTCPPRGSYPLFAYEFGYSAHSIGAAMSLLSRVPNCGFYSPKSISLPTFEMFFDRRVPNRTPFSFPLSNVSGRGSSFNLTAESLYVLPKRLGAEGRYIPIFTPVKTGGTYRIDLPTTLTTDSAETPPCSRDARKWGAPGCFAAQMPTYDHPFRVAVENEPGGVSYIDTSIRFAGDPFGFVDGYLKDSTLTGGEKQTLWWSVGGGSIAQRVSIYFVQMGADDFHKPLPHSFSQDEYVAVARSVPNTGSYEITIPKRRGWGSFLIVPEAELNAPPFIFWSRSYQFRIQCKGEQGKGPGLGQENCTANSCNCPDEPTPTQTPTLAATNTPTPPIGTATPTPTATLTSTVSVPTPTPQASPSSTPTDGCRVLRQWNCRTWLSAEEGTFMGTAPWCAEPFPLSCDDPEFLTQCTNAGGVLSFKRDQSGKIEVPCHIPGDPPYYWVCRESDGRCDVEAVLQCTKGCGGAGGNS